MPVFAGGRKIQTSLTRQEADELKRLAADKVVLEVGSAFGFSTIVMALTAKRVVSVDHHGHLKSLGQMADNLEAYGVRDKVTLIVGDSREALPLLRDSAFDGAFIDGDHTAGGVLHDAAQAKRLTARDGFLAFHDYKEDQCPEVCPALDEFMASIDGVESRLVDTLMVVSNK